MTKTGDIIWCKQVQDDIAALAKSQPQSKPAEIVETVVAYHTVLRVARK
jgi:hypothetical protein